MLKIKGHQIRKELVTFFYINIAIFILFLSAFNLTDIGNQKATVLSAEVDNSFWIEFVKKNPTYRDAWVELNRMDMVKQIDPNFEQSQP